MRAWIVSVVIALCASDAVAAPQGADVVVVIDRAMAPEKLEVVTRALAGVGSAFAPADRLAVVAYARSARVAAPLVPPGAKLAAQLGSITYAEGGNAAVGLRAAYDLLARSKRYTKHVVLISERDLDMSLPIFEKLRVGGITVQPIAYQTTASVRSVANPAQLRAVVTAATTLVPVRPTMAVVVVLDRSGSMNGTKLEAAKELARMTIEILDVDDMVAVVGFDSEVGVIVRPQRAANRMRMSADVSRVQGGGGTNIYAGLKESFEILQGIAADVKHVVLLTDGDAATDGLTDLVLAMRDARITVSAVGFGGADRTLLSTIAQLGKGRLYMADDMGQLPRLFMSAPSVAP
jgi:Mg-chelatase subunit ChlD